MNTETIEPKSSVNETQSEAGLAASGGSDGPSLRDIIRVNDALKREHTMRSSLERVRITLRGLANSLQASEIVKYTGWNVLLVRDGDGWKCVGVVNPDKTENIPEEFDMALPIPDPATLPEFDGW